MSLSVNQSISIEFQRSLDVFAGCVFGEFGIAGREVFCTRLSGVEEVIGGVVRGEIEGFGDLGFGGGDGG